SSGDFNNGMQVYDGTPQQQSPFRVAPRLGFAWDVTADGKTAVRGGAGAFYDRYSDDFILDLIELQPLLNTYTTNYTTIKDLLASPLTATPSNVRRITPFTPPVVYNWSVGVQREVGVNLLADVAYVGNAARNQIVNRALNGRPYGYDFPHLTGRWNHALTKAVFDNWQVSGVTTLTTGTYGAITYSYSNVPTGALSGTGAINAPGTPGAPSASRVVFTCDPNLPRGERTF